MYGSAGIGSRTGVPSWDTKVAVTEHMRRLELPLTVLRPEAFMELMTDKAYYPAASVWHVMPKLMGSARNVPWLAVDDLGAIAARMFADPGRYIGADIPVAGDIKSIDECRSIWEEVHGRRPTSFPMPVWMFERVAGHAGKDLPVMWRWLRSGTVPEDTAPTREIHPAARTVREWPRNGARPPDQERAAAQPMNASTASWSFDSVQNSSTLPSDPNRIASAITTSS